MYMHRLDGDPGEKLRLLLRTEPTGKSWESLLWRRYVAHVIQQNK